jgi:hypothetical protein
MLTVAGKIEFRQLRNLTSTKDNKIAHVSSLACAIAARKKLRLGPGAAHRSKAPDGP